MTHVPSGAVSFPALRRRLLSEPRRPAVVRDSPRAHWYVVGAVCVGAFMGQLDASIVTVALPTIARDLRVGIPTVEWVALAYLLVLVSFVVTFGHLADRVGRKLLYTYGFAIFTAGSALCGLAPTVAVLIAARVFQALGAAMLQANSVALITEALPRHALARGLGVQGAAQALGLALGPIVGGVLLALGGWRLIFLVNIPAGAVGLVLGVLLLPRRQTTAGRARTDVAGAGLLALAVGGVLLYLSLAGHSGYASLPLFAALSLGLAAGATFVRHERRCECPLVDLSMLRGRALSSGLSKGLVAYLLLFGTLFVIPDYLATLGTGSARAGAELAVLPVAIGVAAPVAGRLVGQFGDRLLASAGLAIAGGSLIVIALWHGTAGLVTGLALAGTGLGVFTPANNSAIMGAAPPGRAGLVGGLLNMARGVGMAIGVAVAGTIFTTAAAAGDLHRALNADAARGLTVTAIVLGAVAIAGVSSARWLQAFNLVRRSLKPDRSTPSQHV